jgi:hypothetical protein
MQDDDTAEALSDATGTGKESAGGEEKKEGPKAARRRMRRRLDAIKKHYDHIIASNKANDSDKKTASDTTTPETKASEATVTETKRATAARGTGGVTRNLGVSSTSYTNTSITGSNHGTANRYIVNGQLDRDSLAKHHHDHCSAIIKVLPNNTDILFGHNTWDDFTNAFPRIFKHYSYTLLKGKLYLTYSHSTILILLLSLFIHHLLQ